MNCITNACLAMLGTLALALYHVVSNESFGGENKGFQLKSVSPYCKPINQKHLNAFEKSQSFAFSGVVKASMLSQKNTQRQLEVMTETNPTHYRDNRKHFSDVSPIGRDGGSAGSTVHSD